MKSKILSMFAIVSAIACIPAHAQLSFGNSVAAVPSCPQIMPISFEKLQQAQEHSADVLYQHYFVPVMKFVNFARYTSSPGSSVANILKEIYENQFEVAKNDQILINLVLTVQQAYASQATFGKVNTQGALALLGREQRAEYAAALGKSVVCISPGSANPSTLEVSFYGMRYKDCKRMQTSMGVARIAKTMMVNGVNGGDCVEDFLGDAMKFWRLWSNQGRNQITLVFWKQG